MGGARRSHPSGRPIRRPVKIEPSILREPFKDPLTPGLRRDTICNVIGFHTGLIDENIED